SGFWRHAGARARGGSWLLASKTSHASVVQGASAAFGRPPGLSSRSAGPGHSPEVLARVMPGWEGTLPARVPCPPHSPSSANAVDRGPADPGAFTPPTNRRFDLPEAVGMTGVLARVPHR